MKILIPTLAAHPLLLPTVAVHRAQAPGVPLYVIGPVGEELSAQLRPLDVFVLVEPARGFSSQVNRGFELLGLREDILLVNDDTIPLTPNWYECLSTLDYSRFDRKVAGVGPLTNYGARRQLWDQSEAVLEHPWLDCLSFFWILLRAQALREVGQLDKLFDPGYCEDLDWCLRASKAGWSFLRHQSLVVWHWGSQTAGPEWRSLEKQALEKFANKWKGRQWTQLAK